MQNDFDIIARRASALRMTVPELIAQVPGVSRVTYWRAREAKVGIDAITRVLRDVEAKLDEIERERASA